MRMKKRMQKQTQNKTGNAGFSLVEVILSITILAIISIPLLNYFAESMRYNALMAQKQKATILAQTVVEELKVQERLIKIPEGAVNYSVPYLSSTMGYIEESNMIDNTGKGYATYSGVEGNYDVEVTVSTSTEANENARPVICGIDDTTDVIAVERNQKSEAVVYFMAINSAYSVGGSGSTILTREEVQANMTRTIMIDIDTNGSEYTVRVYYQYDCVDLRGSGSVDSWTSSDLLDVRMATLENIYLLFDRHAKDGETDDIIITKGPSVVPTFKPEFYFICQSYPDPSPFLQQYRVKVTSAIDNPTIRSNIAAAGREIQGQFFNTTGTMDTSPLTTSSSPVRTVTITTKIYEKGHTAGDEPLAEYETTKGE